MSIIYSYPIKSTPANDDLILISDSGSDPKFQTKQIKVSSLPGGSASGVSSFNTLTGAVTITAGNNVTFTPSGQNIEISAAGGGNPPGGNANNQIQYKTDATFGASANLTFSTDTLTIKDNVIIQGDGSTDAGKLKLNCYDNSHYVELIGPNHGGGAASYSVKFPATGPGGNQKILQSDASGVLSWINTPSSGGGGSVDSVNTTDGTFINLTPNSATTGAVTVTADLSATGTAGNTTFLRGDNQWAVPTGTTYSAMTTSTLGLGKLRYTTGSTPAAEPQSVTANRTYGITENDSGQLVVNVPWIDTNTAPVDSVSAGTSGASSGSALTVSPTTGAVKVTSNSYAGTTNVGHVPTGGSATTFLRGDGTWVTPTDTNTDTNIGGNDLILTNNRTLNFYSDTSDKSLTFISTISGTKTLFKFDTVTNKPRFTVGDTASAYEGTLDITGNGSNRTGKINLYNAAGTYSINIQAPTTFGANQNIPYVLPDTQGAASTFLQNNGSGVLTWATPTTTTKLGFTPLSIYEATGKIESVSGEEGSAYSIIRQSVCETDCTIDKVDFFRLAGTDRVTVAVYTGTIASGAGNLRLSGGQSTGTANQINTITFSSSYTFSAGDDIVILVSLQKSSENDAEVLGATNLYSSTSLGRENTTYYQTPASDFSTLIAGFSSASTKAAALHFYDD